LGFDLKDSVAVLGKFEKGGVNIEAALAGMKMGPATSPVKASLIRSKRSTNSLGR